MISVLCVDDEPLLLDICKQYLSRTGKFRVKTVLSAIDAADSLREQIADVIVSDYDMPGMDGIAFLKYIRATYEDLPFILFTGKGREEVAIKAINEGVTFYLQKGGDPKSQFAELSHKINLAAERKFTREALRNREADLQHLFEHMLEGVALHELVLDEDGISVNYRILDVNSRYEDILGISREMAVGNLATDVYKTEKPPFLEIYSKAGMQQIPCRFEIYSEPMQKHLAISVSPWGKNRFATIFTDITEQKHLEEDLMAKNEQLSSMLEEISAVEEEIRASFLEISENKERLEVSEERLNLALENANDGLWDWDITTGETYFSPRYYTMLGYEPGAFPSSYEGWISLLHPDDLPLTMEALEEHFRTKSDMYSLEFRMKAADGTWKWILGRGKAVSFDARGKATRMVGTHTDITESKRIQQALHEANTKLNLLSTITRHDILNQLTILFGIHDIISDQTDDPEIIKNLNRFEEALGAVKRQIEFTRDYQNLGVQAAEWQNPGEILLKLGIDFNSCNIEMKNDIRDLEIFADPLLEKVLYNIIENALRYAGSLTAITACFTSEGQNGFIIIEDDGTGIEQSEKEQIFERGYGKNTGLGLFLAKEILAITEISISEKGMHGRGARFELSIPPGRWRLRDQ